MGDRSADNQPEPQAAALLAHLRRPDYRPVPQRTLLHLMHAAPDERTPLRRLIRRLLKSGKIVKLSGGRLAAAAAPKSSRTPDSATLTGTLHRHRDGYGFVTLDRGGEDLFVAPPNLGEAMSGDRVAVRLNPRGRRGRPEALVLRSLETQPRRVLGVFSRSGSAGTVHPFDPSFAEPIDVPASFRMGAEHQNVVQVEVLRSQRVGVPEGKILEVLGDLDDPSTDVLVMARKYGLDLEFPRPVHAAAKALPARVGSKAVATRERFDAPAPVTIDGETAQDFDDAIAVEPLPRGGFRLFVHIADVAHFVRPGSALDREAHRRGTSVYFPGRVIPMFPEKLSNDLCSLRPGVDRLVQTAILEIGPRGATKKVRFADGVIRSAARLTYTQVAAVLAGEKSVRGVPRGVIPMLGTANELRRVLEHRRRERGSVDFDLPEPQILLDVEGVMTGITIEPRNAAHRLIEECMLAANEAVAGELERRGRSCMYRTHDAPDPAKVEALERFVEGFGIRPPARSGPITSGDIQQLLAPFEDRPEYTLVSQVALRSMKRASYTMENSGHFGLAALTYCHFTSPIRRYPDLVVHRLLREARQGGKKAAPWEDELPLTAESCSQLERNAEAAERELLVRKKIAFIQDKVGEDFEGIVTGVAAFGLFVQLTENLVEGLVRVDRLGNERFEFIEARFELRGTRTRKRYRLGDRFRVRVNRVDRILQRVDLSLADAGNYEHKGEGGSGPAPAGRRGPRHRRPARQGKSRSSRTRR